jgi:predicted transcriptional regulator
MKKRAAPQGAMKVTSVRLDPSLHRRAKQYALDHDTKVTAILNEALAEYLKKRGA